MGYVRRTGFSSFLHYNENKSVKLLCRRLAYHLQTHLSHLQEFFCGLALWLQFVASA